MKTKTMIIITTLTLCIMLSAVNGFADVPAPPVNQVIGVFDSSIGNLEEADCRICHDSGIPDRHHNLYDDLIPSPSLVPYPDSDGDGVADTNYTCLNCHDENFTVVRDCTVCHNGASPHHETASALARQCTACHGDLVDDFDDGHYIPTYSASLVTPSTSYGDGEPLNTRGEGAGGCNYCHDNDGQATPVILTNLELHHGTGLAAQGFCSWCHDTSIPFTAPEQIRVCEDCHGPDSLHNIQADSPNTDNIGSIVVGGEDAGYGHVGRDAGPSDSDCWGCHGFATSNASAPGSGPVTPYLSDSTENIIISGYGKTILVSGSSLTNSFGDTEFVSTFKLTSMDGSPVLIGNDDSGIEIIPFYITASNSFINIPRTILPGNYLLTAVKNNGAVESNPLPITVKPPIDILITAFEGACGQYSDRLTLIGYGFGDAPPAGSEEFLNVQQDGVNLNIESWSDVEFDSNGNIVKWGKIVVTGANFGTETTVNALFGSATK